MLEDGNPPDSFDALIKEAATAEKRFEKSLEAAPGR
jgi:toxin YhaV